MQYNKLEKGHILSENSFFTVKSVDRQSIICTNDQGQEVEIGKDYVEGVLQSGDLYKTEEIKNMTELAELFITNPRVAITVAYYKKDKVKTKTAFKKEVAAAVNRVKNASVSNLETIVTELITNPVVNVIPGELRVMRGRHYGNQNDFGRIPFLDMEEVLKPGDYDNRFKQVDPRTIQYMIVNEVKYTLKK